MNFYDDPRIWALGFDPAEVAGKPCPGCGSGDQIEIEALGGEVIDGQVYHLGCYEHDYPELSFCPACGDATDYCQGHGELGDPVGHQVLLQHDAGDHSSCNPRGCEEANQA